MDQKISVRDPFLVMKNNKYIHERDDVSRYNGTLSLLNDKDFGNLLSVYLDAAFFPNIDELDFMQEGHRFELIKDGDGEKLTLKFITR